MVFRHRLGRSMVRRAAPAPTPAAPAVALRLALGLPLVLACVAPARAAELTVAVPAGTLPKVVADAFVAPFTAATGHTVELVALGPDLSAQAAHADVVLVNGLLQLVGCQGHAFAKLDWAAIGGRDRLIAPAATDCGAGALAQSLVLSWDRQKFPGMPTWAEFWDVAKVPGKRGLQRRARGNLEFAVLADGVAPADVYATLRSAAGVERAFRKLDQLKPYIVWWTQDDEAAKLLASGEVLMTSAPAAGVFAAARAGSSVAARDFAVQWMGGLLSMDSFVVLANAPHPALAAAFLGVVTDPKRRTGLPPGMGPVTVGATDALGAAEKADAPTTAANMAQQLQADEAFWRDNSQKLEAQYQAWLAKN